AVDDVGLVSAVHDVVAGSGIDIGQLVGVVGDEVVAFQAADHDVYDLRITHAADAGGLTGDLLADGERTADAGDIDSVRPLRLADAQRSVGVEVRRVEPAALQRFSERTRRSVGGAALGRATAEAR